MENKRAHFLKFERSICFQQTDLLVKNALSILKEKCKKTELCVKNMDYYSKEIK